MSDISVKYGERRCSSLTKQGKECANGAYYSSNGLYLCGRHSKSDENRIELPKDPLSKEKKAMLEKARKDVVEEFACENRRNGKKGNVICCKLLMMKEPTHVKGYLNVFPNYKHEHRTDGFGCKSLSPKDMGPIDHKQPGLPIAKNLENLHQGNKCFKSEIGEDGNPLPIFYETQKKMYLDPIPHRHKETSGGVNAPEFSIWIRPDGSEFRCTYFQSRQFYCNYYERIAKTLDDFKYLRRLINEGYNIQIVGYDAYPITKTLEEHYLDTSRPFGHELVLYTLLTTTEDCYPWRKYKTENF